MKPHEGAHIPRPYSQSPNKKAAVEREHSGGLWGYVGRSGRRSLRVQPTPGVQTDVRTDVRRWRHITSSLVSLDLPGVSVRIADFRMRPVNLCKLLSVAVELRRIQSEQPGRTALGASGRRRHQRNEGYRSGKYEGLLEEFRHDDISFG